MEDYVLDPNKGELKSALKGVKGWLLFFVVSLILFVPARLYSSLKENNEAFLELYDMFPLAEPFQAFLTNIYYINIFLSIFAGIVLAVSWPRAVIIAKAYLVLHYASRLIEAIGTYYVLSTPLAQYSDFIDQSYTSQLSMEMLGFAVGAAIYPLIWFVYLCKSKRVEATYFDGKNRMDSTHNNYE